MLGLHLIGADDAGANVLIPARQLPDRHNRCNRMDEGADLFRISLAVNDDFLGRVYRRLS
jgi:hypothetical protein